MIGALLFVIFPDKIWLNTDGRENFIQSFYIVKVCGRQMCKIPPAGILNSGTCITVVGNVVARKKERKRSQGAITDLLWVVFEKAFEIFWLQRVYEFINLIRKSNFLYAIMFLGSWLKWLEHYNYSV